MRKCGVRFKTPPVLSTSIGQFVRRLRRNPGGRWLSVRLRPTMLGRVEAMYWIPTLQDIPDEVHRRNTAYVRAGFELTWIVDIQDHCLVPEVITFEASIPNEVQRMRFWSSKWRSRKQCVVQHMWRDSDSSIVILLDPGFNTGMPLLKFCNLTPCVKMVWYTEMDRQEYLTSMGVSS
jgi:hypothetical protein